MKVAVVFLTKRPQNHTIDFAKEISKLFDTFIVVDDESYVAKDDMFICVKDNVCEENNYVGCNILGSTHIDKKVIAWDKFLYEFCEVKTSYDFVWVFEDDVFIYDLNSLIFINRFSKKSDLVVCNNNKKKDKSLDWHWRYIFDKISAPYYFSMVCAMGISKRALSFIREYKNSKKQLFHIEAMFNTICMQNDLKVKTPKEFSTIVWLGDWDIDHFVRLKNNFYHPVKQDHYALRKKVIEAFKDDNYKATKKFPQFVIDKMIK